jgi:hypothetical protein
MPMTNFPTGFAAGLSLRGVPLLQTQPGNVFWVGNGYVLGGGPGTQSAGRTVLGSDNGRGTFQRPFATIAYALTQCQQGNGDIIFVKPGHNETVNGAGTTTAVTDPTGLITTSAGTTLTFNVAGASIIGLGSGPLRPTITFTTATAANIPVWSANMSIQNFLFKCNFAAVASAFTGISASCASSSIAANILTAGTVTGVLYPGASLMGTGVVPGTIVLAQLTGATGAAGTYTVNIGQTVSSTTITSGTHDFNIENCEFRDLSSALNLLSAYTTSSTANASDGFRFANNKVFSQGTTAATTAIIAAAAQARWSVKDNFGVWAVLNNTATLIAGGANNLTFLDLARNVVTRPSTTTTGGILLSSSSTACTGVVYDNYAWHLASTGLLVDTGTKLAFVNNFCSITGAADKSALINPVAV